MTGCVRANRLPKCVFASDSSLKKKGRGAFDYRTDRNKNITAVKWFDSTPVHILSSYSAVEPVDCVNRWSFTEKKYVTVQRPRLISLSNKYMGE